MYYIYWPDKSEFVLHSNLQILQKKSKERSWDWLVNTDPIITENQSVENAGVAFVKGDDERNKFFEKVNS